MSDAAGYPLGGCGLSGFLNERFRQFQLNRREHERCWQRSLDAFTAGNNSGGSVTGDNVIPGKKDEGKGWRSRRVINVTRQKVISAVSIIVDMVLQGGKLPFMYKPAPWDEIATAGQQPSREQQDKEKRDIEQFRKLTEQQLSDCGADREVMRNILAAAIYGRTWGKLRVRDYKRRGWRQVPLTVPGVTDMARMGDSALTWQPYEYTITQPAYEFCSTWDIYFDDEFPKNPQEGAGVYHRKLLPQRFFAGKRNQPGYFTDQIELAMAQAQKSGLAASLPRGMEWSSLPPYHRAMVYRQNTMRYLEYWGRVPANLYCEFLESRGLLPEPEALALRDDEYADIEVLVIMADDFVIRAETTDMTRPVFTMLWQDPEDERVPISVCEMVRNAQEMVNWAVRAYEDNKKQTANAVYVLKRKYLLRGDLGEIKPGDKIDISDDCPDVRQAITQYVQQDVGEQLLNIIQLAEKYADKDSLIPALQQGQDVKEPQMRAFVAERQLEQAGKYIGGIIRNIDKGLIEPLVEAFYDYNMNDPAVQIGKGAYVVKALGFTSFQDRVERISKLMQYVQLILSNETLMAEAKVRWLLEEISKALDLDPDQALKSPADKQQEQAQAQQMAALQGAGQQTQPDPTLQAQVQALQAKAALDMANAEKAKEDTLIKKAEAVHRMTRPTRSVVAAPGQS